MNAPLSFAPEQVLEMIPHRPPFLFVDRILELWPGERILAERWLDPREAYFTGHFPGDPIMPGVLIGEALAQASGLLAGYGVTPAPVYYLAAASLKFSRVARPGETLQLRSSLEHRMGDLQRFHAEASAGGAVVAGGVITLARAAVSRAPGAAA